VSLTIPHGSFVAFVGSSGAGKSTLVDLLLGLLKPESGQITVGGLHLSEADHLQRWQQNIGYVPQSIYLCDGTVAENIAFGVEPSQIDMVAVSAAATAANISQFVEEQLPSGYQTHVGERGVRLSGGQRQRLGIARALYHNPQVIVFDEATSALDNVTEASVMSAIAGLAKDKTIILIAHRMSTVKDCQIIYFMQSGKLLAAGSYSHLVQHSPEFFDLVNASSKATETELSA
jgi:ATP-binding cassette subfamily C protein